MRHFVEINDLIFTPSKNGAHTRTQGGTVPCPSFGPVIRSITSQTNKNCSLLSLILAKLLLSDISSVSCENIFALSMVTARTACLFPIKKCAKIGVFYVKTVKIR